MRKEQKEGVFIVAASILVLLVLALLTSHWQFWQLGVSEPTLYFQGFEYVKESCSYSDRDPWGKCPPGHVLGFFIEFKTILIFFLPMFSYGILRAFNIIKRLSRFEEKLFFFIADNSDPDFLYRHLKLVKLLMENKGFTREQASIVILNNIEARQRQYQEKGLDEKQAIEKAGQDVYKLIELR